MFLLVIVNRVKSCRKAKKPQTAQFNGWLAMSLIFAIIIRRSAIVVVISRPVVSVVMLGWSSSLWRSMIVAFTMIVVMRWRSITTWVIGWWSVVPVTMGTWRWLMIVTLAVVSTTPPGSRSFLWLFYNKTSAINYENPNTNFI